MITMKRALRAHALRAHLRAEQTRLDQLLVQQSRSGSALATSELAGRHAGKLYQAAFSLCGCNEHAVEIVTSAFLCLIKTALFEPPAAEFPQVPGAWLARQVFANAGGVAVSACGPLKRVDGWEEIQGLVQILPEGLVRNALMLRVIGGLAYEEMAPWFNTGEGTLRTRVFRATHMLAHGARERMEIVARAQVQPCALENAATLIATDVLAAVSRPGFFGPRGRPSGMKAP